MAKLGGGFDPELFRQRSNNYDDTVARGHLEHYGEMPDADVRTLGVISVDAGSQAKEVGNTINNGALIETMPAASANASLEDVWGTSPVKWSDGEDAGAIGIRPKNQFTFPSMPSFSLKPALQAVSGRIGDLKAKGAESSERRRAAAQLAELQAEDARRTASEKLAQTIAGLVRQDKQTLAYYAEILTNMRAHASPIETEDNLALRNPSILNAMVRAKMAHKLACDERVTWSSEDQLRIIEQSQNQALLAESDKYLPKPKRYLPLGDNPNPEAHTEATNYAWHYAIGEIEEARETAVRSVYIEPYPEGSTHREHAFEITTQALDIQPDERAVQEIGGNTRQLRVLTRAVAGPDGYYVPDPKMNGIGKIINACEILENNDPLARDYIFSGLVERKESDTYEGGLCLEFRITGVDIEAIRNRKEMGETELDQLFEKPAVIISAEVEPRHVSSDTMVDLVMDRAKRYGEGGDNAVIDPMYFPLTAARALSEIVIPAAVQYAKDRQEVNQTYDQHKKDELARRGWSHDSMRNVIMTPPAAQLPSGNVLLPKSEGGVQQFPFSGSIEASSRE